MRGLVSVFILVSFFTIFVGCDFAEACESKPSVCCELTAHTHVEGGDSHGNTDAPDAHCHMHCAHSSLFFSEVEKTSSNIISEIIEFDLYHFLYKSPTLDSPERPPLKA